MQSLGFPWDFIFLKSLLTCLNPFPNCVPLNSLPHSLSDSTLASLHNTFSIYQILPQLIELWGLNTEVEIESKKKLDQLTVK